MNNKIKLLTSYSIWFTGYPSSGKTTIAKYIKNHLQKIHKIPVVVLDGDKIRSLLNSTKNYSLQNRIESTKFYIRLSKILLKSNLLLIVSANHALKEQRIAISSALKKKYCEIWISTHLNVCKNRDVKGLFFKAKKGKIKHLVGYDIKFDKPNKYDLKIDTKNISVFECYKKIEKILFKKKIIKYEKYNHKKSSYFNH